MQKNKRLLHVLMADPMRMYHNPRCTKSRAVKQILDDKGVAYETVLYLEDPPSLSELKKIAEQLDGGAMSMLRAKEAKEEGWDPEGDPDEEEILEFIATHPRALQRPIVKQGDKVVVGRPPERVHDLL